MGLRSISNKKTSFGMNKKGQVLSLVSGAVVGLLGLILVIFAVLFAVSVLRPASFFTTGTPEFNATQSLQQNLTEGSAQFGARIPAFLSILGVVMALAAIVILVVYVSRLRQVGGGGGGSGL